MPSFSHAESVNDALTPERILRDAANAEFVLLVARWLVEHWAYVPPLYRSALTYSLDCGGESEGNTTMTFEVPLRPLLEAMIALR